MEEERGVWGVVPLASGGLRRASWVLRALFVLEHHSALGGGPLGACVAGTAGAQLAALDLCARSRAQGALPRHLSGD